MSEKIHFIVFRFGYVESSSWGHYIYSHTEGFDTVYDAVKDLTYWLLKKKREAVEDFWCYKDECPIKDEGGNYKEKFCSSCGKKAPNIDIEMSEILWDFDEYRATTADSLGFEQMKNPEGCGWWEWSGIEELIRCERKNIAFFPEKPMEHFLLTAVGDEFGKIFKEDLKSHRTNPVVCKFFRYDEKIDFNDPANHQKMIDIFEKYRLSVFKY